MPLNVHKVSLETTPPSKKAMLKAAGCCLRGHFREAQGLLRGEQWLVSYDGNGKKLFGISGGGNMTMYVGPKTVEAVMPPAPQPAFPTEAIVAKKAVTVRKAPVTFKK